MLGWADESVHRLESLTNKFLIYLELESSKIRQLSFNSSHTKLSSSSIESRLQLYTQRANRSNDFMFSIESAEISLSEKYFLTVINELVDNAMKFSSLGTTIKVSSQVVEEMFNLSIQDLGRGMTEDQIDKIGAFMQFDRKIYEQQGIGLGLRIVKKIVELAGGKFSINSIYQQETTVNISLPIAQS